MAGKTNEKNKTKEELISELEKLRRRVAELNQIDKNRKQAEEALRESQAAIKERERLLNQVGDIAKIGGWEMDLEKGGKATWTRGTYEIVEIEPGEPIPGAEEHIDWYLPEYREMIKKKMKDLIETKQNMYFEAMLKTKKGNLKWCRAIGEVVEENGRVVKVRGTFQDITEHWRAEQRIQKDLAEKEVLLKEIHHRVKNNLNVVTSLLNLQSYEIHSKEQAVAAFQESRDRIYSMALVHEQLYKTDDFAKIEFKEYIKSLGRKLDSIYNEKNNIAVTYDLQRISLDINTAVPCGLILNELITNAFKHAFRPGEKGNIRISFRTNQDKQFHLVVGDDGVGLPEHFNIEESKSLGLQLVRILTEQIQGKLSITQKNGVSFHIRFTGV